MAEPGHHRRVLRTTGIDVQENQARRLLNDIASFRSYLERKDGTRVPMTAAASRWLKEVYDPVMNLMPPELASRLSPPEIFHEILEHRWYLSEEAGHDVGTTAAARSYFATVLPAVSEHLVAVSPLEMTPRFGEDTGSWMLDDPVLGMPSRQGPVPGTATRWGSGTGPDEVLKKALWTASSVPRVVALPTPARRRA